jgi:high affinity Mn2+ porin
MADQSHCAVLAIPMKTLRQLNWIFVSFSMLNIFSLDSARASEAEEAVQAKFQTTYVWQYKPGFSAAYSGARSLSPSAEKNYSLSTTAFLGTRAWQGCEVYFNPEMVMSHSLSKLTGLAGFNNGEDQKGGGSDPTFYTARLFVRQTLEFGGDREMLKSAPNQLAGEVDKRRLVMTAGKISLIDIFDNNSFSHDPRTQFLNWSFMTYGAFDYAADTRGYTIGAALEYYHDDWAIRMGRFEQPIESNELPLDSRLSRYHGDQVEIEHAHEINNQQGKLRVLAFHNRTRMGGYQDALDLWNQNGRVGVPDFEKTHKDRTKTGYGVSLEQSIVRDVGLFFRASQNDGGEETYAFTDIEKSLTGGLLAKVNFWGRPNDTFGVAYAQNGLSSVHQQYLADGGPGFFIGDGKIKYRPEGIVECFYSMGVVNKVSLSFDYQHINNPAYNADRGPVNIVGTRLHMEY